MNNKEAVMSATLDKIVVPLGLFNPWDDLYTKISKVWNQEEVIEPWGLDLFGEIKTYYYTKYLNP